MRDHSLTVTRRVLLAASAPALLTPAPAPVFAASRAADVLHIGMSGNQIHAARFDPSSGALTGLGPVAEGLRPTWAVQAPGKPILYYVDESASEGRIVAFLADRRTGALEQVGEAGTGGLGTTHLWLDRASSTLIGANFSGGSVASLSMGQGGVAPRLIGVTPSAGSGPHRRQTAPHPHGTVVDPSGRFLLVADLGADRVYVASFDRATGRIGAITPDATHHYAPPPGSGPRHMAFGRSGRILYLINELSGEIHVLSWDGRAGRLSLVQVLSINDDGFAGQSSGGEIGLSADGRFVYATNRADSSLVVHAVDGRTGRLTRIQKLPSGGDKPWHFALHPNGRWMLVANRDANALRVFSVDRRTGRLADSGQGLATPAPLHVHILAA